jgi:peptide/nickel transport system ATP-binding protein
VTALLQIDAVSKRFSKRLDAIEKLARALGATVSEHTVHALDRVSFDVAEREVVGLVGESGCGKSTLGRLACGLHAPPYGTVRYRGQPVTTEPGVRRPIQMIFQDPFASLNPRMRVSDIVGEAPRVHGIISSSEVADYVAELLQRVGLDPSFARRYPHQFSGGQRARVGIARALAVKPEFLVCD